MRVYAPVAFRYNGVDYPYGYQEVTDTLGDVLKAASLVLSTTPTAGGSTTLGALTDMGTYDLGVNNPSVAAIKANVAVNTAALNVQTIDPQVGTTYTLVLADAGQNVDMNNASPNTLTVPPNSAVAFPIGTLITVTQAGAGTTTLAPGAGVTFLKPAARILAISAQYETASLYKVGTDTWRALVG